MAREYPDVSEGGDFETKLKEAIASIDTAIEKIKATYSHMANPNVESPEERDLREARGLLEYRLGACRFWARENSVPYYGG